MHLQGKAGQGKAGQRKCGAGQGREGVVRGLFRVGQEECWCVFMYLQSLQGRLECCTPRDGIP